MAISNFYNVNAHITYPFQPQPEITVVEWYEDSSSSSETLAPPIRLPNSAIVDVGFMIDTPYDPSTDSVYLSRLYRLNDTIYYEFKIAASHISSYETITFTRDTTSGNFITEWAVSKRLQETSCKRPAARGFMVSGFMSDISELLDAGETILFSSSDWVVEPARIQVLNKVNSINIANMGRTKVTAPTGCVWAEAATSSDVAYVAGTCIQGDVTFSPGYNCEIIQNSVSKIITFSGVVGAGLGQVCDELPIYPGQPIVVGTQFYTGGQSCESLIKTINGQTSAEFVIMAGNGVVIAPHETLEHTLVISFNVEDEYNNCQPSETVEVVSPPVSYYFDFGTATSPVTDGYVKIEKDHLYNLTDGYGWIIAPDNSDYDDTNQDPLLADYVYDVDEMRFRVDLPAGTYSFSAYVGSDNIAEGTGTAMQLVNYAGYDEVTLGSDAADNTQAKLTIMPVKLLSDSYVIIKLSALDTYVAAVTALEVISLN